MPYAIPLSCSLRPATFTVSRPGLSETRVTELLENWATYMHRPEGPRGFSAAASCMGGFRTRQQGPKVDRDAALITGAVIDDLRPAHRAAVHNAHLGAVFRVRDQARMYSEARETIRAGLNRRGIA